MAFVNEVADALSQTSLCTAVGVPLAGRDFFAVSAGDMFVQGKAETGDALNVIVANGAMAMGGGIPIQLTGGQYA